MISCGKVTLWWWYWSSVPSWEDSPFTSIAVPVSPSKKFSLYGVLNRLLNSCFQFMQDCSEIMELLLRTQTDWQDLPEDDPQVSSLCRQAIDCNFIMKFQNLRFQNENLGLSLSSRSQHFDWPDFDSSLLQIDLVVGNKQFCELYSRRCPPRLVAFESSVPTSPGCLGVVGAHLAWSPLSRQCPPRLVAFESSVPTSPGCLGVVSAHLAWLPRSRRCPPRLVASESSVPTSPGCLGVVGAHLAWLPRSRQCPPRLVASESSVPTSPGCLGVVSAHLAWSPWSRRCPPRLVALESSVPTSPGRLGSLGVVRAHLHWSPRSRFDDSTTELIFKSNI